jgi:5-methyltetrahydropteroyltriglutamate--homocysteine methyltransferase
MKQPGTAGQAEKQEIMNRSVDRILTTHCGSLPRPKTLIGPLHAKDSGGSYGAEELAATVRNSVAEVVRRQIELGIDIIDDGEHSKSSFATYARLRIGGLEKTDQVRPRLATVSRDALAFPAVYADMQVMFGARAAASGRPRGMNAMICSGPIKYIGAAEVLADIENLKLALRGHKTEDAFITAISPTNLEMYFANEFYNTDEDYLVALAEAMNEEYRTIVGAGFLLQIDDPRLITHYNRAPEMTIEECRKFIALRVEIVNHALRGIPEDRVRFHTCYSVNVGPRVHDLELKHYVDLMLKIKAQAYSIEAANPRHEHEWEVWREVKLLPGKILIPGVVSHCVYQVEHPELVAQRIEHFAGVVGRENVIASNDCGFATSAAGDEVHPDVAWAKLESLSEGARIATKRLWS